MVANVARVHSRPRVGLGAVLAYKNDEVIARFCGSWRVSRAQARQIFADLMRYLWLCHTTEQPISPVPIVDEMWHMFLVYTRVYRAFAMRFFGGFMEHEPTSVREGRAQRRLAVRSPALAEKRVRETLERDITLVVEHLGKQVALRWYATYSVRYGGRFFRESYRPKVLADVRLAGRLRRR
jgi:hypothetical protein